MRSQDRAHRLGQTKPVTVIRLITAKSVDERIHALAQRKLELDAVVMRGLVAVPASTGPGKQAAAEEVPAMRDILQAMLGGTSA